MLNNRKRRPTHPGQLLRDEILPDTGLSRTELAKRLGISQRILGEIINERRAVTADLAHRFARVFDTTPELWLNLQQAVGVWESFEANRSAYTKIRPLRGQQAA